jgi:hypothetical protein
VKIDDDPKISLDGIDIKRVKQAKTLGIVIDKRALFMYKIRNNEFPECLTSMFNTSNNKNYNLRSNKLDFALPKPKPNTKYFLKSFKYSGAALWNDLPKCAKDRAISVGQCRAILNNMEEQACK